MNVKGIILACMSFLMLVLFNSCGHSEYYENGYDSGYSQGQSDVRSLWRITDSSERRYMDSNDFKADVAYEMMKQTTVFGVDPDHESEYRSGFLEGYDKGVEDLLDGNDKGSSDKGSSESDGGGKFSSSRSGSSSGETGITFWQWIIILVVTVPIITWLGFGADIDEDTDKADKPADKSDKAIGPDKAIESDSTVESDKISESDTASESGVKSKERTFVKPWKSFLLVVFVFLFDIIVMSSFHMRVNNWSTYIIPIMCIGALYYAYENAKTWSNHNGKSFMCGLTRILAVILSLVYLVAACVDLYSRFFQ